MFGKKIVISDPLLYRLPLLLRQLKNNQNQTNTTGTQTFKKFNNTAEWLSFFCVFSCNELIKQSHPQTTPPLPSRLENKKDKCSHLVIWTSTLSIIRIEKLFVIGNQLFFISQTKKLAKDGCVITFFDNFILFWVPSMKNINLNILKI